MQNIGERREKKIQNLTTKNRERSITMKINTSVRFQKSFRGKGKESGNEYVAIKVLGTDFEGFLFFISPEKAEELQIEQFHEQDLVNITINLSFSRGKTYVNLTNICISEDSPVTL